MTSRELKDKDLVQKFNLEALECNSSLVEKWKQYKKEYEELNTCLDEFPKELSASILMPLGSKVFVRAQLCNTNEVFIRYGDVFTKQTAYEAKGVCKRHIERCDNMIKNLSKEKEFLTDNFCARHEIVTDSNQVTEIIEPFDEDEHAAWKEKHKQKVKEYKQSLANQEKLRKAKEASEKEEKHKQNIKECKQDMANQEKIIKSKEAPEKEEKGKQNIKECDQDLANKKNIRKAIEALEKEGVPKIFPNQYENVSVYDSMLICMGRKPEVTYSDDSDDENMDDDDDDEDSDDIDEDDMDDDEDEDSKLEIVFTNDVPETTRNLKKKIVKKVSFNNDVQIKEFEPRPDEHFIRRREVTKKPEIIVTELDDIVERVMDTCLEKEKSDEEEEPLRPVSRFKASRNKSNNVK